MCEKTKNVNRPALMGGALDEFANKKEVNTKDPLDEFSNKKSCEEKKENPLSEFANKKSGMLGSNLDEFQGKKPMFGQQPNEKLEEGKEQEKEGFAGQFATNKKIKW